MNFRIVLILIVIGFVGVPTFGQETKEETKKETVKDSTKKKSIFSARVRGAKIGDNAAKKDSAIIKSSTKIRSSNTTSKKQQNLSDRLKTIQRERNTKRAALEEQKRRTDSLRDIARAKAREAQKKPTKTAVAEVNSPRKRPQKSSPKIPKQVTTGKSAVAKTDEQDEKKDKVKNKAVVQQNTLKQKSTITSPKNNKESELASKVVLNATESEKDIVEEKNSENAESITKKEGEDTVETSVNETKLDSVSLPTSAKLRTSKPAEKVNASNENVNDKRNDLKEDVNDKAIVSEVTKAVIKESDKEDIVKPNDVNKSVKNKESESLPETLLEYNPNGIKLYSNQARTELTLEFKEAAKSLEYEIINNRGKSMYRSSAAKSSKETVNISRFKKGSYFVRLKSENHEDFIKFVLK